MKTNENLKESGLLLKNENGCKIGNEPICSSSGLVVPIEIEKVNNHKKYDRKIGWRQYSGVILALLAALCFSLVMVLVKVLRGYHPFSLSAWRQLGNIVPSIPMVIYFRNWKKENIFDHVWPLTSQENRTNVVGLALRGFLGASAVILKFYALDFLTIADVTVVHYSSPIFVIILAKIFLKEKSGVTPILIGIWTFLGVVLIARPPFLTGGEIDINILIGTGISLVGVMIVSTVTILVRKIRKIHFSVMTLAFGIWGFAQSFIVAISFGVLSYPKDWTDAGLTALLAILSFLGQICAIMSLKFEQAGPISLIRTTDVLFAFLWQTTLLSVTPDLFSILGASVVMVGVVGTATRKWVSTLPNESLARKQFKFLLK